MNFQSRKSPRLKGYDYSTPGYYFITVCTNKKRCILGRINENSTSIVGEGLCALPKTQLTNIGKIVKTAIEDINKLYVDISVDKFVVMPNHIHIIVIKHPAESNLTGGHGDPPLQYDNTSIVGIVSNLKSYTTHLYGKALWQRSFHDHIIRGEKDYLKIWEYIDQNPAKWREDCFFTE